MASSSVPNVLSDANRVNAVIGALGSLQQDELGLDIEQIRRGAKDGDAYRGTGDGEVTFGVERQRLKDAQGQITAKYSDIMSQVKEQLESSGA